MIDGFSTTAVPRKVMSVGAITLTPTVKGSAAPPSCRPSVAPRLAGSLALMRVRPSTPGSGLGLASGSPVTNCRALAWRRRRSA